MKIAEKIAKVASKSTHENLRKLAATQIEETYDRPSKFKRKNWIEVNYDGDKGSVTIVMSTNLSMEL